MSASVIARSAALPPLAELRLEVCCAPGIPGAEAALSASPAVLGVSTPSRPFEPLAPLVRSLSKLVALSPWPSPLPELPSQLAPASL
jgi:hypothetical protein